jgi:hypothetical protein
MEVYYLENEKKNANCIINDGKTDKEENNNNNLKIKEKLNTIILQFKNELEEKYLIRRKIVLIYIPENNNFRKDFSFFNSLIQCIGGIPDILLFLQNNQSLLEKKKQIPVTHSFFVIIKQLYDNKSKKEFEKNSAFFFEVLKYLFPILNTNIKNPIDLYHLLILHIERELRNEKNNNSIKQKIKYENNKSDTFISQTFISEFKKETKCALCEKTFDELQNFYSFDLDIINTYKEILKNEITISDCLEYYIRPKNAQRICCVCYKKSNLEVKKTFYQPSKILVFVLNRNNRSEEIEILKIRFIYEEIIDISNYIDKKLPKIEAEYILIGVVAFSLNKQKFISFCRNILYNEWFCFNEDTINECNYNDIINSSTPYILFYKRMD